MSEQQLLSIIVPIDLRDDMVDVLAGCDMVSGFNMSSIAGYSREHSQYDLRELVEGYRALCQFDVIHQQVHQVELLAQLQQAFVSTSIRYWITPIREQGHL
tara:strand:- start:19426 stop:19728 length:303 start_codon:yes stop_codon:yes gene_type:complete